MIRDLPAPPIRVLVVSNNSSLQRLLRSNLRQDPRFQLLGEASDGDEAVAISFGYELAVVDLRISGLGVFGVLSQLRHLHPERSVVVVASSDVPYLRYAALREGAADYIVLPDELDEVPQRLIAATKSEVELAIKGAR